MPIYEYLCSKCGKIFEAIQKFNDKPLTCCKFCQGKVERLISNSNFQLKGSGWYLTDYARKSQQPSDSGAKSSEKSTEGTPPAPSKQDKTTTVKKDST